MPPLIHEAHVRGVDANCHTAHPPPTKGGGIQELLSVVWLLMVYVYVCKCVCNWAPHLGIPASGLTRFFNSEGDQVESRNVPR